MGSLKLYKNNHWSAFSKWGIGDDYFVFVLFHLLTLPGVLRSRPTHEKIETSFGGVKLYKNNPWVHFTNGVKETILFGVVLFVNPSMCLAQQAYA